tara:strand:- start:801 stop:1097 length:297 start_codon:yes stop_codon:yes gene_type:complete
LNLLAGTLAAPPVSVPEQLVERAPGFLRPLVCATAPAPVAQCEVEVLAEVGPVFFRHRLGAPLAALVRYAAVVKNAVEADAQVLVAAVAAFTAAGLPV